MGGGFGGGYGGGMGGGYGMRAMPMAQVVMPPPAIQSGSSAAGPVKIFVGSLPDSITDMALRAEFSKYGQVTDCFLKQGCETGRQWAFVTFATPEQAQFAKDATDRILTFPGGMKACEVMLAKNQGKCGQAPLSSYGGAGGGGGGAYG